jgi:inorganic pyrophosphatase
MNVRGCNVDCFVLTEGPLKTGQLVDCVVAGLMEQFEDGHEDHNVLAVLPGTAVDINEEIRNRLSAFVMGVFEHIPGKRIAVGRFSGPEAAESYVAARRDLE